MSYLSPYLPNFSILYQQQSNFYRPTPYPQEQETSHTSAITMPMSWNAEADAKLFAAVMKVHEIKVNYQAVAAEMGSDCTPKAITHRIAKIKAENKEGGGASSPAKSTSAATPRKRAAPTPKKHTSAKKSKVRAESDNEAAGGENFDQLDDSEGDLQLGGGVSPSIDRSRLKRSASANIKKSYQDKEESDEEDQQEDVRKSIKREDTVIDGMDGLGEEEFDEDGNPMA